MQLPGLISIEKKANRIFQVFYLKQNTRGDPAPACEVRIHTCPRVSCLFPLVGGVFASFA